MNVSFLIEIVIPLSTTFESPRNTSIPASVVMNGGTCTNAIQKPIARPTSSISRMDTHTFTPLFSISVAPTAPTKQTIEPTERSMLPPVRIHNNIPVASTNTYAFCAIKLLMFCGSNIFPPVFHAKNAVTSSNTIIIVYFFTNSIIVSLFIVYSPLLDFRM